MGGSEGKERSAPAGLQKNCQAMDVSRVESCGDRIRQDCLKSLHDNMGNAFPITSPPRQSESRAIIYLEPKGIFGKLEIEPHQSAVPSALSGLVSGCIFQAKLKGVSEKLRSFRGGCCLIFVWNCNIVLVRIHEYSAHCLLVSVQRMDRWSRYDIIHHV